jgi:hypothetical protein
MFIGLSGNGAFRYERNVTYELSGRLTVVLGGTCTR